jgi:hypothetical protein
MQNQRLVWRMSSGVLPIGRATFSTTQTIAVDTHPAMRHIALGRQRVGLRSKNQKRSGDARAIDGTF